MIGRKELTNYKPKTKTVTTSQGDVLIREMTGAEYFEYLADQTDAANDDGTATINVDLLVKVCLWCLLNEDGSQMFAEGETEVIKKMDPGTMFDVYVSAAQMSGLTVKAVELAKKS